MVNIDNGIKYNTSGENYLGSVNINYNQIVGIVPSWTGGYTTRAIYAQDGSPASGGSIGCILSIRNNLIYKVYNGIKILSFQRWAVRTDTNTIALTKKNGAAQYGINHTSCTNARAIVNYIVGDSTTGTTTTGESGMVSSGNSNDTMRCNIVDTTYKGFEFVGVTNISSWHHNEMRQHTYSMFLNGNLGIQGSLTTPCDNIWGRSCTVGSGIFQTFNNAASTLAGSVLYTRDNTSAPVIFDPWLNNHTGIFPQYGGGFGPPCSTSGWYDGSTLIRVASPPTYASCEPSYTSFPTGSLYARFADGGDTVTTGNGDDEGRSTSGSADLTAGRRWINQMATWEALQSDTTMTDSGGVLNAFKTMAASSRYKWLTDIAGYISQGNYTAANNLLSDGIDAHTNTDTDGATGLVMRDGTAADYVVQNYLDVYRYNIKYATDTLGADDIADVLALANLCPDNDGKIVFAARTLYYNLTGSVLEPEDNCLASGSTDTRQSHPGHSAIKNINELTAANQSYSLMPNPNDGNLTVTQTQPDNSLVKVQVLNALGRVVYSSNTAFVNGKLDIRLHNAAPGLYLLQLSDNSGNSFTRKFVVQ